MVRRQVITDEEIERDVLEAYRPLTSPDGVNDWTTHGEYSVVFRRVQAPREVWVETPVTHFSVKSNAKKIDKGAEGQSYYYGNLGGWRWGFKGRSSVPVVRFGNNTQASYAIRMRLWETGRGCLLGLSNPSPSPVDHVEETAVAVPQSEAKATPTCSQMPTSIQIFVFFGNHTKAFKCFCCASRRKTLVTVASRDASPSC